MKINGIEIKPGMVLIGENHVGKSITIITIPIVDGLGFLNVYGIGWSTSYSLMLSKITEIKDIPKGVTIESGDLLWKE